MVPFAGFLMPIQYVSITQEHRAVREQAGVFDVSHMGEFIFGGRDALEAVQRVTVNDVSALSVDQAQYSAMVNEDGGIIDDCVVYRLDDNRYMMVVNASNIAKDWAHVSRHLPSDVTLADESESTSLLAVQGPEASRVMAAVTDVSLEELEFYWKRDGSVASVPAIVSRTGYTGELEMRYALYGSDIDETVNPYEAALGWIVKLDKGDFVGRDRLKEIADSGPKRRLVGFRLVERGIPRTGYHPAHWLSCRGGWNRNLGGSQRSDEPFTRLWDWNLLPANRTCQSRQHVDGCDSRERGRSRGCKAALLWRRFAQQVNGSRFNPR